MPGRSSAATRVASVGATPGSRRAATDSSRRLGHAAKKSPSSGTNGDVAKGDAFPARDLADSLSAFAAVDFSAEKSMLENAGLTPPTRAVNKAAATPASGRRALGDLANLATDRSEMTMTAEKPRPAASAFDDWSVTLNASVSPSAAVTERASMLPKSPAETLAERALAAAAASRRLSVEADPATSPPADDAGSVVEAATTTPAAFRLSPANVSSRAKRSAERARVMATHAARVHDAPSGAAAGAARGESGESGESGSPVDRVMLRYAEGKASDELLDALELELRAASAVSASVTFLEDREDLEDRGEAVEEKRTPEMRAPAPAATEKSLPEEDAAPPVASFEGGSPFVRLVAEDVADEDDSADADDPADADGPPAGDASGTGSGAGGSERVGSGSGGGENLAGGGDDVGGGGDDVGGGGGDDAPAPRFPRDVSISAARTSLPPDAGVTLAHALGKWREAVAVAAIEAEARRVQTELAEIMRGQAADCDDEVNALSDENEMLTAALAASAAAGWRARWRLAARAAVLSKRCDERKTEARRLRVKARKLESQLLKVEEHITSAAADFDRLRGRLHESTKETERARADARDARARLAEAQAATSVAQARRARSFERDENVSPLASRARNAETAVRAELRDEARAKIYAEVRAEVRAELGDELRAEAEAEATADATDAARNVAEASAASGAVAACIDGLLRGARSTQMRRVASARKEATIRARENLERAAENGVDTLRLGADPRQGGVDPLELVSLIAVHALERCEAHPHGDGARAFYRAARRVELAARACQPEYRAEEKRTPASRRAISPLTRPTGVYQHEPDSRSRSGSGSAESRGNRSSSGGGGNRQRARAGGAKPRAL